jgi:hypothetical protein
MMTWILSHLPLIISTIITLIGIAILYKTNKIEAKKKLYELVMEAEEMFIQSGQGEAKLQYVLDFIAVKYPLVKLIPKKDIIFMIEEIVKFANRWALNQLK